MPLPEQMYCTQQINVPPMLPSILKQFCKAAIRTQPYDLLKWSSTYFRALADGEELPIKLRLEYPPPSTESGLTIGFLKVLLRQFGDYNKYLSIDTILRRWDGLCLDRNDLDLIIQMGEFCNKCQVKKFLSIGVALLTNSLHETMVMVCELFTHEPEGGSAMIPLKLFLEIYEYLAGLQCDGTEGDTMDVYLSNTNEEDIDKISVKPIEKDKEDDSRKSVDGQVDLDKFKRGSHSEWKEKKQEISHKHPKVPGIGPRLLPAQLSNVVVWLTECSELQEGMVGPRNLRHFSCPSLDEPEIETNE
ncbi:ropporin-1-like protein [Athalia rosae]|uniref:ropporin-1-like protein n=1 Tax=Athalia rosae TaxID=37344 RepID=UPI002033A4BE|nr:ropporin-1-like protein [Athalia rosae]